MVMACFSVCLNEDDSSLYFCMNALQHEYINLTGLVGN